MAREASLRGLSTLLLDARDVAAGTSSRSSRLVHGGLRYLRNGHFALVKEALHERERLLRLAPHLVRPLPMLMPFYPDSGVARWQMRLGTLVYSRLAGRSTLPRARAMTAAAAVQAFPGLRTKGLKSAIEFFDARTQDARLTLANVVAAVEAGCRFANHAEVLAASERGLQVRDHITQETFWVRAKTVLNAAGPAVDAVRRSCDVVGEDLVRLSRGSHVVLPPRKGELALAAFLPDQRIQFVIPHDGGTLCGTTDVDDDLSGNETAPPPADLDYLRAALAYVLEPAPAPDAIRFAYAGWRALPRVAGPTGALHREAFLVAEAMPGGTMHTVIGGKLTTHRSFAERAILQLFAIHEPSPTRTLALPGGDGPREVDDALWWRHGSRLRQVRAVPGDAKELSQPLCGHRPFLVAELVHALQHLGAVTFSDLMLRRLVHVLGPCLEDACLRRAHQWFMRERRHLVDDEPALAVAALQAEVREMTGDLEAWRTGTI